MATLYRDRTEAGQVLARALGRYAGRDDLLVLALPRGGMPVAAEVARALGAPLDVLPVRKLAPPGQEGLAMGAVASGDVLVVNPDVIDALGVANAVVHEIASRAREVIGLREALYRDGWVAPDVRGRVVVLVDDGMVTGVTARAAAAAVRQQQPAKLVLAVPTAPPVACHAVSADVDELVCPCRPEPFLAIALSYVDFPHVSDDDVRRLLAESRRTFAPPPHAWHRSDTGHGPARG